MAQAWEHSAVKYLLSFILMGVVFSISSNAEEINDNEKFQNAATTFYTLDLTFQQIKKPCSIVDPDFSSMYEKDYLVWKAKNRTFVEIGKIRNDKLRDAFKIAEEKFLKEGFPKDQKEAEEFDALSRLVIGFDIQLEQIAKTPVTLSGCQFFLSILRDFK